MRIDIAMPTGIRPWEEIAMDLVRQLREYDGFNTILLGADRFTKMQRYLSAKTSCTAEDMASIFDNDIWRHYALPKAVTSDKGPQFASASICQCLLAGIE